MTKGSFVVGGERELLPLLARLVTDVTRTAENMLIKTTLTNSHVATVAKADGFTISVLTSFAD